MNTVTNLRLHKVEEFDSLRQRSANFSSPRAAKAIQSFVDNRRNINNVVDSKPNGVS